MRNGACIIASNVTTEDNIQFDYIGLAKINARLIRKYLNIPVALLTTSQESIGGFDDIVRLPPSKSGKRIINHNNSVITFPWDNDYRVDAFQYSPYDRTLLIDADYIVLSSHLQPLIECDAHFMIVDNVVDVTGRDSFNSMRLMPDKTFHQRWATVMAFDKKSKTIFDAARMVRENYRYYSTMFNFSPSLFRNDYVFSIAAHLLGIDKCPIKLFQSPVDAIIDAIDSRGLRLTYDDCVTRWNYDLHVLNKDIVIAPSVLEKVDV